MMTDAEAAAIQERADKATEGPIKMLLADRAERTRLLREVARRERRLAHESGCDDDACDCGLDALLAEIREAMR